MSAKVQSVPKVVDSVTEKSVGTHARRKHDKLQHRRISMGVVNQNTCSTINTGANTDNTVLNTGSGNTINISNTKKSKHDSETRHFKTNRKRVQSFNGNSGKFFPPYKRRKKEGIIVPPTKFLLGGNIRDPLNLNSLQDEEINR